MTHVNEPKDALIASAVKYIDANTRSLRSDEKAEIFSAGQRVRHSIMGTGEVLEADEKKGAYLIKFDDIDTPRSISFRVKLAKA